MRVIRADVVQWSSILAILVTRISFAQELPPTALDNRSAPPALQPRTGVPRLRATRTAHAPTIDGTLDDMAWQEAIAEDAFTQKSPRGGNPPSERTTMRVLYDEDAIYVGFDCQQQHTKVVGRLARRDRQVESDSVTISIDTRRDGTSAFEFSVNAAGVLSDGIRFNDTDFSSDWDENWEARVARTAQGWSAELRIPLRVLRFDTLDEQEWGFQARRYISMRQETNEWSYIPLTTAGEVSHYGRLGNLRRLDRGHLFELRPFAVGRSGWLDMAENGPGITYGVSAGLDLKLHVTQNLILDATINPDFAQAEADPTVLNLTTYENVFPETRSFFIEGLDVFQSPRPLFYSRRIGLVPDAPALRDGESLVDAPAPTTIYGASKLVGTVGERLSVGALVAVTGRNDVEVQPTVSGQAAAARLVDPPTLFDVLRVRLALGQNAHVGLLGTAVKRFEPADAYPDVPDSGTPAMVLCPDGQQRVAGQRCFHDAYVGGMDGRWRSSSGAYVLGGQALLSAIVGGPPRQMPDGTVIRSGDTGAGGKLQAAKEGGNIVGGIDVEISGRALDFNDLGFMRRQNHLYTTAHLDYRTTEPFSNVLETRTSLNFFSHEDIDLRKLLRGYTVRTDWKLQSFWSLGSEVYYIPSYSDDREIGNGAALQRAGLVGLDFHLLSDPRRWLSAGLDSEAQRLSNGHYFTLGGKLILHVLPQLDVEILPQIVHAAGEPRYIGPGASPDILLFGKLKARSIGTTLRASYTFTPQLSLQLYTQLFLAAEHYAAFSSYVADPAIARPVIRLGALSASEPPPESPDFAETSLDINAVLRWELMPGSTLFVVYTRAQAPDLTILDWKPARLDPGALRKGPGENALLLKLSYWLH